MSMASDASDASEYESDDGQWHPPFHDAETGEYHEDVYGTLSETASTIVSPDGVAQRFLELIGEEKLKQIKLFIDIGCGKGRVVNLVAKQVGCKAVGIDILQAELDVAQQEAATLGVAEQCSYVICDFREFYQHIPKDVEPHEIVCYTYLIPKMVSNRELRQRVVEYLARGTTFVTWSYHAAPEWPHLHCEDTTFNIKVFQKQKDEETTQVEEYTQQEVAGQGRPGEEEEDEDEDENEEVGELPSSPKASSMLRRTPPAVPFPPPTSQSTSQSSNPQGRHGEPEREWHGYEKDML